MDLPFGSRHFGFCCHSETDAYILENRQVTVISAWRDVSIF